MTSSAIPQVSLHTPEDLLDAIPYMLGFRPEESLVVVGIDGEARRSRVSVRMDLPDDVGELAKAMPVVVRAFVNSGATHALVAVLSEDMPEPDPRIRWANLTAIVAGALIDSGLGVMDFVLGSRARWWSALCVDANCCPVTGSPRSPQISVLECELVHQGVLAHPSREAAIAAVSAVDAAAIEVVGPMLEEAERRLASARSSEDRLARVLGEDLGLMLAEIRRHCDDSARRLTYPQLARLAVALQEVQVRDEIWTQLDSRLVDLDWVLAGMASRLPGRYRAAPLFLWGWQSWRNGSGVLAREAARCALEADPSYSAAEMLDQMVLLGLDPQTTPTLSALDQR